MGAMPLRALAALAGLVLAGCNIFFEREGLNSSYEVPGPDPTGIDGIERDVPPLTEEGIVEVHRVSGRVLVRLAGERGSRNLEYWKPSVQTGPHGVIQTGPNAVVRLTFADESTAVIQHTSLARVGDRERGEPRLRFERLTRVEWTPSADAKEGPLEVPGGALIWAPAGSFVKVELIDNRNFQVSNDGRVSVDIEHEGRKVTLRTAERVDLPVVRNAPHVEARAIASEPSEAR